MLRSLLARRMKQSRATDPNGEASKPNNHDIHPFLKGNFAPVTEEFISYRCDVSGRIPDELLGGQYIRNGGNPVYPPEKGRHYHW